MGIVVTPDYADIFEDKPTFSELTADIPTRIIVIFGVLLNAELYNHDFKLEKQVEIFQFVSHRWSPVVRKEIATKIWNFHKDKQDVTVILFAKRYAIELIHRALLEPKEFEFEDTTPEQELRLFKAYLLVSQELNNTLEPILFKDIPKSDPRLGSRHFFWPLFVHQNEINHSVSPHFQSIKLIAFLKYLVEHSIFNKYLTAYMEHLKEDSPLTFIYNLMNFLHGSYKRKNDKSFIKQFSFIQPDKPNLFLQSISLDIATYAGTPKLQINYKGLKETPVFEYQPNSYAALSYDLLYNKVYNGFVFDFYNKSGLNNEPGFKSFPDFKSRYSKEFSEQHLFRSFIRELFNKKHTILGFVEEDGAPDCYVRIGNNIFLLEFKDYFFSDDIVVKAEYNLIKKDIDEKFIRNKNGKSKGIVQQANQIEFLETSCYQFDDFISKGLKRRNLTIYPVIIHTNHIYTIPDVNDYLNDEFKKLIKPSSFKVKDVILIELETIFRFLQHFMNKKNAFKDSLDKYLIFKKNRAKKFKSKPLAKNFQDAFCSYETAVLKLGLQQHSLRSPDFIRRTFDILGVKRSN